jgi:hypothetical protein
MGRRAAGWAWSKVSTIHERVPAYGGVCEGEIRWYTYRYHAPSNSSYARCIGLAWCSTCREYSGAMVHVPRDQHLIDLLADLPALERQRLTRSEVKLLDHLDRLARRGAWPTSRT